MASYYNNAPRTHTPVAFNAGTPKVSVFRTDKLTGPVVTDLPTDSPLPATVNTMHRRVHSNLQHTHPYTYAKLRAAEAERAQRNKEAASNSFATPSQPMVAFCHSHTTLRGGSSYRYGSGTDNGHFYSAQGPPLQAVVAFITQLRFLHGMNVAFKVSSNFCPDSRSTCRCEIARHSGKTKRLLNASSFLANSLMDYRKFHWC
eukprot:6190933-Pleurochrysis_carterae.AAC.7